MGDAEGVVRWCVAVVRDDTQRGGYLRTQRSDVFRGPGWRPSWRSGDVKKVAAVAGWSLESCPQRGDRQGGTSVSVSLALGTHLLTTKSANRRFPSIANCFLHSHFPPFPLPGAGQPATPELRTQKHHPSKPPSSCSSRPSLQVKCLKQSSSNRPAFS